MFFYCRLPAAERVFIKFYTAYKHGVSGVEIITIADIFAAWKGCAEYDVLSKTEKRECNKTFVEELLQRIEGDKFKPRGSRHNKTRYSSNFIVL